MKKIASILLAILLACMLVPSIAEGAFTVTEANSKALAEDYTGDWTCAYAAFDKVFDAASNLDKLGMESLMTIQIKDNTAAFTGMPELGTDPLPLTFADGAMVFEPEAGVKVFTLQLLQDGALSMTFNMIQMAPKLYMLRTEK